MNIGRLGTIFHSNDKYLESYLSSYKSAQCSIKKAVRAQPRRPLYVRTTDGCLFCDRDIDSGTPANKSITTTICPAQKPL